MVEKRTFHGKEEKDYQGRFWIAPPKDAKAANDHCFIPKRLVHTWSGHTKGVSAIRFFPKHGHLILSAGMDTKVKIWDVYNSGKCMRTYMGHTKAVWDIWFSNDRSKFLTTGYDKRIKYWDTETGQVIQMFSTGKIPYVVRLNPGEDKQNVLLADMSDKKIVQWDINSGQITQEYNQHLGTVNTITFVDNNRSTRERFQLNKKKRFAGHIVAGYGVNFSPDGRFVLSGDGEGRCWFWDWKSCKPKYYGNDYGKMLEILLGCKNTGCTFLVGGRNVNGTFKVLEDFDIPAELKDMFVPIPVEKFRMDISSTEIRKTQGLL
ncbi:hypothetical protein RDI58_012509 [Solanum bulbocastanum]|uniref:Uncharacterized protein n=1 Tax=Solanum bulbocastanum TaxID=147425 RepID=A0AAN8YEF6_SOLBU